jgi:DNA polymerase III psi subunit
MSDQLTNNPEALRLFFTEEIYLVDAPQHSAGSVFERVHDKVPGDISELGHVSGEVSEDVQDYVPVDVHRAVPVINEANGTAPDLIDEEQTSRISQHGQAVDIESALPSIPNTMTSIPNMEGGIEQDPQHTSAITASDTPPTLPDAPAAQPFSYVGANERNILILVNDERFPVSTQEGRELLGNILKAIGLNRNDCALVNYITCNGANFQELNDFFEPQYVFAFGVTPEQLDIAGAGYNRIVQQGASKLIFSSNLDALSGDATTKKLLWGSLKQIKL